MLCALRRCREVPGVARQVAATLAARYASGAAPRSASAVLMLHEALGRSARQHHLGVVSGPRASESGCTLE